MSAENDIRQASLDPNQGNACDDSSIYIKDLIQFMPQPLYFADAKGIIVEVSQSLIELSGYTASKLVGQMDSILFVNKEDATNIEEETIRTGKVKARGTIILTKDARKVPVSLSTYLAKYRNGYIAGYVAALSEVSGDKQVHDKIEQVAREWRATLDAIRDLVWISDKDCHLLRVNRAYAGIAGIEPKQLIGKICHEVFSWSKDACPRCPHKKTIATKESAIGEFYNQEHATHFEIATSPIFNDGGEVIASVCVARDITNRKEQEKQIHALDRLRQYFSPKLAQKLISDEDLFKVRRKYLTVFFIDIRGFTALSDETEPEELLGMLNEYLSQMTQIIFQWGGTVGKFIGDGIMGFFGDPDEQPDHAELAVKMALEMQSRVKTMNEKSPLWSDFPLSIGIGINTGFVTIGNIGPENHRDYTIIGRHVNLAARLEQEAKPGQVLISQRTYKMAANIARVDEVGLINVKGFDKPVPVYNVLGLLNDKGAEGA